MALKDIWKLQDYIPESFKQLFKARVDAANDIIDPLWWVKVADAVKTFTPTDKETTGAETLARNNLLADALSKSLLNQQLPPWLITIITIGTQIQILAETINTANELIIEKNVLQPLRKQLRPVLLNPENAVEARQRDFIDDTDIKTVMSRAGISDKDIAILQKLALFTPGPNEIAGNAGRGAYDDASASLFGKDEGLAEMLGVTKTDRDAAGLSDEHFKRMWRSHWQNPELSQVVEMLRRHAIDLSTLEAYFKTKDIPPFWKKPLIDISTNILNKLDIRKLHKAGIITNDELKPLFLKIGYGLDDADKLARGTIFGNQHPEAAEITPSDTVKQKQKDLTGGTVLNALSDGLITTDKAKSLLNSLGYSPEEINLLMAQESHDTEKAYIKTLTETYRALYIKGLVDGDTINKKLSEIPLTSSAITKLFTLWNLERMANTDAPSRTDILRWHKKKYINDELTEELLKQTGTSVDFIPFYIKENS